jgi:rhodanese-related sulfurtransferase
LADDFDRGIESAVPDNDTVNVYCQNEACDASPKVAAPMDELGYANVYNCEAGKDDWKSAGLATE